ncbi:DUF4439 domain-containing protein [Frankia sp. CcI49]|uniref:DUF4439 domain-containing protein n=1 Tax=Frankia sp. CcI49 TaxID=1745382 RepID=UPI0018E9D87F|nr:DUF4439 domain-containing protein [Frankia sp. CcI49]
MTATTGVAASGAPDPQARALSSMLASAHAAVYAAAAAGGVLAPLGDAARPARDLARTALDDHRALRDSLVAMLRTRGATPPPALAAYQLPVEPAGIAGSLDLLARIEDQSAVSALAAVDVLTGADREMAVDTLVAMTLRGQRARLAAGVAPASVTAAFPGR